MLDVVSDESFFLKLEHTFETNFGVHSIGQ
jgi:hypothetical protein